MITNLIKNLKIVKIAPFNLLQIFQIRVLPKQPVMAIWNNRYWKWPPYWWKALVQSTPTMRTPRYYGHPAITDSSKIPRESYRRLTEIYSRYYGLTDTLSVPTSQFYCFLSRYSGHRAASWNSCTHIKSTFSAFWDWVSLFWSISASVCPSIKIPSSFSLKALFAVSLPWISSSNLWWFKWLTAKHDSYFSR